MYKIYLNEKLYRVVGPEKLRNAIESIESQFHIDNIERDEEDLIIRFTVSEE